jgi:hypothetical protein
MDEATFISGIKELESYGRSKYDEPEMRKLKKDILQGYHPTASEWRKVVDELGKECNWLPRVAEINRKMMDVRKRTKSTMMADKVPCNFSRCEGEGYVMVEKDGFRTVLGCGCNNTPRWIKFENTLKHAIDKGIISMDEVTTLHRRPIMTQKQYEEWRWNRIIELYKEDKWVPKFMRERFDAGNFEKPTVWPGGVKETQEQLKDMPF